MPDRYGRVTGQDWMGLANQVRGIKQDSRQQERFELEKEDRASRLKREGEADVGFGIGRKGGELPENASASTAKGYGGGLAAKTTELKSLENQRDLKRRRETDSVAEQIAQSSLSGGSIDENFVLTPQGASNIISQSSRSQDIVKKLQESGTSALSIIEGANQYTKKILSLKQNQDSLMRVGMDRSIKDYEQLQTMSQGVDLALKGGDRGRAAQAMADIVNLANIAPEAAVTKGGKIKTWSIENGEKVNEQVSTVEELQEIVRNTTNKQYALQSAARAAKAQEENQSPNAVFTMKKGGKIYTVRRQKHLNRPGAAYFVFDEEGNIYTNKKGDSPTRLDDLNGEGFVRVDLDKEIKKEKLKGAGTKKERTQSRKSDLKFRQDASKHVQGAMRQWREDNSEASPEEVYTKEGEFKEQYFTEIGGWTKMVHPDRPGEVMYKDTEGMMRNENGVLARPRAKKKATGGQKGKETDSGGGIKEEDTEQTKTTTGRNKRVPDAAASRRSKLGRGVGQTSKTVVETVTGLSKILPKRRRNAGNLLHNSYNWQRG